jgi:NAD(P)-dependent dehydrogenase (short-subunit alcohol dehydrogenase family)
VADAIVDAGGSADAHPCNIGNMEDIANTFTYIREKHGRLDILVNNAATNPYFGHVLDTDVEGFQKTVDVNIRGYFFMSIEGGKLMRESGGGVIVNTASVNGLQPAPMQGIYSITKAAVISMTKSFAKECAQFGIRCNALLPGLTKTQFAGGLFTDDDTYSQLLEKIPMQRHATPNQTRELVHGDRLFTGVFRPKLISAWPDGVHFFGPHTAKLMFMEKRLGIHIF